MTTPVAAAVRRNPQIIAYAILVAAIVGLFAWQNSQASERRAQICNESIDRNLLFDDLLDLTGGDAPRETMGPRARDFYTRADRLLERVPGICGHTDVDVSRLRRGIINPSTTTLTTLPGG